MNLDPLAEEYFNLSPYNYVSNTPIRAIDPNGMEIVIIGDKNYTQEVINFLANLGSSSQKGAQLVINAINSDKKFIIFDPNVKNYHGVLDDFNNEDGYEVLGFDIDQADGEYGSENGRNGGGLIKTGETQLAHELAHFGAQDNSNVTLDGTTSRDEVNAVKEENQVRREMGLPERTHYNGINVYGKTARTNKNSDRAYLIKDKDYSVNVNGIGKKSFQLIFKHYTNMQTTEIERNFAKNKSYLFSGKFLDRRFKNKGQKTQLILNDDL